MQANNLVIGFDIGTRSIVGVAAINDFDQKDRFRVEAAHVEYHPSRSMLDGQIQDINQVAKTIYKVKGELERKIKQPISQAYVAAAGRVLQTRVVEVEQELERDSLISQEMISHLELMALEKAKEDLKTSSPEDFYAIGHSVMKYYLNGYEIVNLLDQRASKIGLQMLATFLPREVVDSLYLVMEKADMKVAYLTLEPIAASQIAIPESFRLLNIALVDVGAGTSDIAITNGGSMVAYGMIPIAGDEITEAIVHDYLVDFNMAEKMKIDSTRADREIEYVDIMDMDQKVDVADFLEGIKPTVEGICSQIASKIKALNGDKVPNAIFIVGGGGQVKGFSQALAEKIGLPPSRVSLRGKEALKEVEIVDPTFMKTPDFITPIGICYKGLADRRRDFVQVFLNDKPVKLFHKKALTIMDIMVAEGIDPRDFLITKGEDLHFYFNGKAYSLEGQYGQGAHIYKNQNKAVLSDEIADNDYIVYQKAKRGRNAKISIYQWLVDKLDVGPEMVNQENYYVRVNGRLIPSLHHLVQAGDKIYCRRRQPEDRWYGGEEEGGPDTSDPNQDLGSAGPDQALKPDAVGTRHQLPEEVKPWAQEADRPREDGPALATSSPVEAGGIWVLANGKSVFLTGKPRFILVDIFDYIDFDRSQVKGKLMIEKNGQKATYFEALAAEDVLEIYWA